MTAIRIIDDHKELDNVGSLTHDQLDSYVNNTTWVVVSGTSPLPPAARVLVAGTGVQLVDTGTTLVINVTGSFSSQQTSWNETPTGAIDGINDTFVFSNSVTPASAIMLFLNGIKQKQGIDSDFTVTGSIVVFVPSNIPRSGSNIEATYPY